MNNTNVQYKQVNIFDAMGEYLKEKGIKDEK